MRKMNQLLLLSTADPADTNGQFSGRTKDGEAGESGSKGLSFKGDNWFDFEWRREREGLYVPGATFSCTVVSTVLLRSTTPSRPMGSARSPIRYEPFIPK